MGIQTREGNGVGIEFITINSKEGCFQMGSKSANTFKKFAPGSTRVSGIPFKFEVKADEYDGQKSLKAQIYLRDPQPGQPAFCVTFGIWSEAHEASASGLGVLAKLYAANPNEVVSFSPWHAEKGTKIGNYVVEAEGGQSGVTVANIDDAGQVHKLVADYLGQGDRLPAAVEVKISATKTAYNKEAWNPILEGLTDACFKRFNKAQAPTEGQGGAPEGVSPEDLAAAQAAPAPAANMPSIPRDNMRARA